MYKPFYRNIIGPPCGQFLVSTATAITLSNVGLHVAQTTLDLCVILLVLNGFLKQNPVLPLLYVIIALELSFNGMRYI